MDWRRLPWHFFWIYFSISSCSCSVSWFLIGRQCWNIKCWVKFSVKTLDWFDKCRAVVTTCFCQFLLGFWGVSFVFYRYIQRPVSPLYVSQCRNATAADVGSPRRRRMKYDRCRQWCIHEYRTEQPSTSRGVFLISLIKSYFISTKKCLE